MSESSLQLTKDAQLTQNGVGFNLKLTQGGAVLLAKALAGQQLEFKYVTLGSGVGSGNPEEATSFVNKVADLFITKYTRLDTSVIIEATLEYNSVPQGFTWTELGVIAIDPDTQAEVLYMYDYVQIGEVIPPAGTATQIEKHLRISTYVSNAANVTAEINESLINIPRSDIGKPNGVAPLGPNTALEIEYGGTGAKTAQEALYNLGAKPNDNLLRNWYLVGGGTNGNFPINQQGKTSYTGAVYGIDGWKGIYGSEIVNVLSDKIQFIFVGNQGVRQIIEFPEYLAGKTVTLSILWALYGDYANFGIYNQNGLVGSIGIESGFEMQLNSTTFTIPDNTSTLNVDISGQGTIDVYAVKLEIGENQTLARQLEDGSWQLLEKPDYANKLLECQRYYYRSLYGDDGFGTSLRVSPGSHYIPFKATMRKIPNIKLYGTDIDSFTVILVSSNGFILTNTDTVYTRACDFEAVAEL